MMGTEFTGADRLGADGDDFYSALMEAHEGLSETESHSLNARLVLIMANEIGDLEKIKHLLGAARSVNGK